MKFSSKKAPTNGGKLLLKMGESRAIDMYHGGDRYEIPLKEHYLPIRHIRKVGIRSNTKGRKFGNGVARSRSSKCSTCWDILRVMDK